MPGARRADGGERGGTDHGVPELGDRQLAVEVLDRAKSGDGRIVSGWTTALP
jgi:predicted DNA-binding protein